MKKLLLIFLGVASFSWADSSTPLLPIEDPATQRDFQSLSQKIASLTNPLNITSGTISQLQVSTIAGVTSINGSWPNPNILINGGFEFWQRSSSSTAPANSTYVADRWKVETGEAAGVTISTETTTKDNGTYSAKVIVTSASGGQSWRLSQAIENWAAYAGKTITLSFRVFTVTPNAIKLRIDDNVTSTNSSAYHTGSGWETLSMTFNVSSSASQLIVYVGMIANGDKKTGTYYFDSGMLTTGNQVTPFIPDNYQVELAKCQRYYAKSYDVSTNPGTATNNGIAFFSASSDGSNVVGVYIPFKVTMRTSPTITYYRASPGTVNTWDYSRNGASSTATPSLEAAGTSSFWTNINIGAAWVVGLTYGHWTADAEL